MPKVVVYVPAEAARRLGDQYPTLVRVAASAAWREEKRKISEGAGGVEGTSGKSAGERMATAGQEVGLTAPSEKPPLDDPPASPLARILSDRFDK